MNVTVVAANANSQGDVILEYVALIFLVLFFLFSLSFFLRVICYEFINVETDNLRVSILSWIGYWHLKIF